MTPWPEPVEIALHLPLVESVPAVGDRLTLQIAGSVCLYEHQPID